MEALMHEHDWGEAYLVRGIPHRRCSKCLVVKREAPVSPDT